MMRLSSEQLNIKRMISNWNLSNDPISYHKNIEIQVDTKYSYLF